MNSDFLTPRYDGDHTRRLHTGSRQDLIQQLAQLHTPFARHTMRPRAAKHPQKNLRGSYSS